MFAYFVSDMVFVVTIQSIFLSDSVSDGTTYNFKDLFLHCRPSPKARVDVSENLTLEAIRHSLISQEDSIIFSLLGRAQYCYNGDTYDPSAFSMDGFSGSLVEYMVMETEKLHAQVLGEL